MGAKGSVEAAKLNAENWGHMSEVSSSRVYASGRQTRDSINFITTVYPIIIQVY